MHYLSRGKIRTWSLEEVHRTYRGYQDEQCFTTFNHNGVLSFTAVEWSPFSTEGGDDNEGNTFNLVHDLDRTQQFSSACDV